MEGAALPSENVTSRLLLSCHGRENETAGICVASSVALYAE